MDEFRRKFARFRSQESLDRGLRFRPRPDDLFVSTYPKCGTTWTQQIVHALRSGGSTGFRKIGDVVPWLESAWDLRQQPLDADQGWRPRAYKTHLDFDRLPKGGRAIYVVRDPKDVATSMYHFLQGWIFEGSSIPIDGFVRDAFIEGAGIAHYWTHVRSWWPTLGTDGVLWLCYEELKEDLPGAIRQIARFMNIDPTGELVGRVAELASFAYMKEQGAKFDNEEVRRYRHEAMGLPQGGSSGKVRRGLVGAGLSDLSPGSLTALDDAWERYLAGTTGLGSYADLRERIRSLRCSSLNADAT